MPPLCLARLSAPSQHRPRGCCADRRSSSSSDAPSRIRTRHRPLGVRIVGIHPYALKFPMMRSDEQLADLADDIARNGQREPIDITPGGLISSSCRSNKT